MACAAGWRSRASCASESSTECWSVSRVNRDAAPPVDDPWASTCPASLHLALPLTERRAVHPKRATRLRHLVRGGAKVRVLRRSLSEFIADAQVDHHGAGGRSNDQLCDGALSVAATALEHPDGALCGRRSRSLGMAISCYAESHGCPPTRFRLRSNANRSSQMSDECGDSHSQSAAQENSQRRSRRAHRQPVRQARRALPARECAHRNHCDPSAFGREE